MEKETYTTPEAIQKPKEAPKAEPDKDAEKIEEAAARLYAFFDPWEQCETTQEETAEEIRKNPYDAILYLLDILEG